MATLPSHSPTLDQVFTRYAYAKVGRREYKDQKYKLRPLLKLLDERKKTYDGGAQIVHPVNLGTSSNGKSLSRNQTFTITGDVNETWSRYTPSVVIETVFVSWWDIQEARGNKFKMQSVLDSRIAETDENMADQIATMLSVSTAAESTDINPLLSIVATSGATGGLNPSTSGQENWASQNENGTTWSTGGIGAVRSAIRKVQDRKGNIDVLVLPDTFWDETCEIADNISRYNADLTTRGGTKVADLGVQVPFILGTPIIHDPAWNTSQTATGLGLDLSGIHLVCDSMWTDYMYPFKENAQYGRLGQSSVKVHKGQLTCSSRRTQTSFTSIS